MNLVQAKNYTRGRKGPIRAIVIHTMEAPEGPKTAENIANWFAVQPANGAVQANGKKWGGTSAHYCIDSDSEVQCVADADTAWHAGQVNGYSIGVELTGYAKQTPAEWKDPYSIAMLDRAAKLCADLCRAYGIPVRRAASEDIKTGTAVGFMGHMDVSTAFSVKGGHMDPGPHFPWIDFLDRVASYFDGAHLEDAPAPVHSTGPDDLTWTRVGDWEVTTHEVGPVSLGEAVAMAKAAGAELPTPALVDAIWQAAPIKIAPRPQAFKKWTADEMDGPDAHAKQEAHVDASQRPGVLDAGGWKNVIKMPDGRVGLYGWHMSNGKPIQPPYFGHAMAWRDYSQGCRLVRRIK
jgi:N-acetyl-anhydromuramyl-L-alanine amidase AmpD